MALYLLLSVCQTILGLGIWMVAQRTSLLRTNVSSSFIISYFVYVLLFQAFVWSGVSRRIGQIDIRRGQLSLWLLKPCSYFVSLFLEETSWRILRSLMTVPIFIFFFYLFRSILLFDMTWFFISLLFFPFGYVIYFLTQSIVGVLAFWFEDIEEYIEVVDIFMVLFSGVGIPILFFPQFFQIISSFLPFQYVLYMPTMIALNKVAIGAILHYMLTLFLWIAVLGALLFMLWKKGLKRYTGEGI